jgi:hypothetical protein
VASYSFTFTAASPPPGPCICPDLACPVPVGWDRAHSDTLRPYTLDELAARADGPHFHAYPGVEEYQAGWRLWRALRIESRLTPLEDFVRVLARAEILGGHESAAQWRAWHPHFDPQFALAEGKS